MIHQSYPQSFQSSESITAPLITLIISQDADEMVDLDTTSTIKKEIKKRNRIGGRMNKLSLYTISSPRSSSDVGTFQSERLLLMAVCPPNQRTRFPPTQRRVPSIMHYACIMDGSHTTHLRPITVVLSSSVDHAMICHMGGFPTICHNEICDIIASLLTEVCINVATEPPLQPLSGESITACSANTDDGAHLEIHAKGLWNVSVLYFFDIRVFYPNASSSLSTDPSSVYRRHEQAKKQEYGQ